MSVQDVLASAPPVRTEPAAREPRANPDCTCWATATGPARRRPPWSGWAAPPGRRSTTSPSRSRKLSA